MTKNMKLMAGIGGLVLAAIVAWLAFGVFGVHTLFVDETVSEANPFEVTTATAPADNAEASADAPASTAVPNVEEDEPESLASVDPDGDAAETSETTETTADAELEPTTPPVPQITTLAQGSIVNHDHSGVGTVTVITDGTERFLRFEDDFAVDNGPDLNVYLSRGAPAEGDPDLFDDDFIDLGDLKGNIGAQNYQLSPAIDLAEYNTVVIWCVRFGVAFNAADLA